MRRTEFSAGLLICSLLLLPAAAGGQGSVAAEDQAGQPAMPDRQGVYIVLRDMGLAYERVQIRTIVPNEEGASALVVLQSGTLVDVVLVAVADGWTLRDIFYVAGNGQEFRTWTAPWQRRVAEAERFLAASRGESDTPRRRPQELAPLVWFEDVDESTRLWGLNPVTYRIMQTLKLFPSMGGPMEAGANTGSRSRRQ